MPRRESIVFLDVHSWDYNAETPWQRPLGGTQSAACYLAAALAARGHRVALSTSTSAPGSFRGVECVGENPGRDANWLRQFDTIVILGTGQLGSIRNSFPATTRFLLWTGFNADLKVVGHLSDAGEQAAWSGFAFASLWQMRRFRAYYRVPPEKCRVLRYGAAPPFIDVPARMTAPGTAPHFLHTSSPDRGLSVLLDAWPAICAALPGARLTVTSSRRTYMIDEAEDDHRSLYERARAMPGVDYVGALSQPELAQLAARCDALLYPSIFAETGCIAAIEAMCAGLRVVTTDLAVLPETCAGYAALVEYDPRPSVLAPRFANAVIADMQRARMERDRFIAGQVEQQRFFRAIHDWVRIAAAWEDWLQTLQTMEEAGPVPAAAT